LCDTNVSLSETLNP